MASTKVNGTDRSNGVATGNPGNGNNGNSSANGNAGGAGNGQGANPGNGNATGNPNNGNNGNSGSNGNAGGNGQGANPGNGNATGNPNNGNNGNDGSNGNAGGNGQGANPGNGNATGNPNNGNNGNDGSNGNAGGNGQGANTGNGNATGNPNNGNNGNDKPNGNAGGGGQTPCFVRGTLIDTAEGLRAVETLAAGDIVVTRDNGLQAIRWIGGASLTAADLAAAPELGPIRIAAGALGNGTPRRDLFVSPLHRVLVRSDIAKAMTGHREVLVAARALVGLPGIEAVATGEAVEYFHILFDRHEIVLSEGAETESFFISENNAATMPQVAEIRRLFPALFDAAGKPVMDDARFALRMPRSQVLAERQMKTGKPLVAAE